MFGDRAQSGWRFFSAHFYVYVNYISLAALIRSREFGGKGFGVALLGFEMEEEMG